ncbi:MAG: ribonuclease HIII [Actinomycetota bacterium]|nr:ribonuclease HIII [Actinomycetota bacterium]
MSRLPTDLEKLLRDQGARVSSSRPIDYGTQYKVSCGSDTVTLNVYHRSGKVSTGGKASPLLAALEGWRSARAGGKGKGSAGPSVRAIGAEVALDATPRVGTDEAGKGDYFGPLVVAGVRVLGEAARGLREAGARDSKTLSVMGARAMALKVLDVVGEENTRVVTLGPGEYEARRVAAGNINRLLGEINVQVLDELKDGVEAFVVDEFAKAAHSYIRPSVPKGIRLVVRPRAEDDAAVAAASILARSRYLEEMDLLSGTVGFELPRGATHVISAAKRIVRERGEEALKEIAKVHFGTTEKVLGGAAGRR